MSFTAAVCISNMIGFTLILVLLLTNYGIFDSDPNVQNLKNMGYIVMVASIADILAYYCVGKPGIPATIGIYFFNSLLFASNMLLSLYWDIYLRNHIGAGMSRRKKIIIGIIIGLGFLILIINLFYPLVFSAENNIYERKSGYYYFVASAGIFMLDGIAVYLSVKQKGGILVYFPMHVFITPVLLGVIIQTVFYGVSVIWVGVAIAITGMVSSLKNERLFVDQLTGAYNRYYMEQIKKKISRIERVEMTAVMADLNDFKSINDNYGHNAGDDALIETTKIFQKVIGEAGKVIRYAGDEFILLINSKENVDAIISGIYKAFDDFNSEKKKKYQLSVAMGFMTINLKDYSIDEFMNVIDTKMYEDKSRYKQEKGL